MTCLELGCEKEARKSKRCAMHEMRIRRHGSAIGARCSNCKDPYEIDEASQGRRLCDHCFAKLHVDCPGGCGGFLAKSELGRKKFCDGCPGPTGSARS